MSGPLHGIEDDVPFDHGTCEALITFCTNTATLIDDQATSRAGAVTTGSTDFQGRFAEIFRQNASVARGDRRELVSRLREVATFAGELQEQARAEQERRRVAREWKREQEDRNLLERGYHWLFGEDVPPVGPPDPPLSSAVPSPPVTPRDTPTPGTGAGGGGGTSSARPASLREFARVTANLNSVLTSKPTALQSHLDAFATHCRWGTLDGSAVVSGFRQWNRANDDDVTWANTVAGAFEAAGGEGNVSTLSDAALLAALQAAGVNATRDDLSIDPAIAQGNPPTTGYAADPINTATGNFIENEVDIEFGAGATGLSLTRTYNSFDRGSGAFGPGWSSWTESRLAFDDEGARLTMPDGRVVVFPRRNTGWDRATGENLWLEADAGGIVASDNQGQRWLFDADGTLATIDRGPGSRVSLRWESQRLVRMEHARHRAVDLRWDEAGERVVAVDASDGRSVSYAYDDAGRLVAVTGPEGTRTYTWDAAGLIASVTDADGVREAMNTYDDRARVVTQLSPFGRLTRFTYLPGRITVVADEDGGRSNTWLHDHRGRLVGVIDSHARRQSKAYDGNGNPVMVTERDGGVTLHAYDERGRRVRTVTPTGADIDTAWDDRDRIVTVIAASGGVTRFDYTGDERNPSLIIDPEGGRTALTWRDGLLTEMVGPTGVVVRFTHDIHGNLVATTDAEGNSARLERDAVGRVVGAITPSGARTGFAYDEHGHLASRTDPDGAVWRFEHTPAGRLTATVDPLGARTVIEPGDHGEPGRTIDPLGRVLTRELDDLGNLASVELPDGSTWGFRHDSLSRLVATTDPTGGRWLTEYDANGVPTATEDPTGVRLAAGVSTSRDTVTAGNGVRSVSLGFDPLGRHVRTEQADGSAAITSHDRCGRVVEKLDADGGLTRIVRDAAGRPVAVTDPTGATTRYEYDRCGRLSATIDALGGRTTRIHDADGRTVRVIAPDGGESWATHDPCGRVTELHRPGRGTARYTYDLAGRLTRVVDPWFGRRRFRYDAAGQLVAVTDGNGGTTRFEYDANGRNVVIVDPLGGVTRRTFDAMNRCTSETDPLGRTIRARYDAAGRVLWQEDAAGHRVSCEYDATGRVVRTHVDGALWAEVERDLSGRRLTVTDHSAGATMVHELEWDRRGQLVRRSRDGQELRWGYDAAGRRRSMTAPDGSTTRYERDAVGRLVAVDHPLLGRAVLTRDAAGRVVAASAGGTIATWEYTDGFVSAHTLTDAEGVRRTEVERDGGRVSAIVRGGVRTTYAHDGAGQLVAAEGGGVRATWAYDAAGRLVREASGDLVVEHTHDAAGQLLASTSVLGATTHAYDAAGRRTRTDLPDGRSRSFAWSALGALSGITDREGDRERVLPVRIDVGGELISVGGTTVHLDSADPVAPRPVQVGDAPVVAAGPLTGVGADWFGPGWRGTRSDTADPWGAAPPQDAVTVGTAGELSFGGLEWLGARMYDPAARSFLAVDPLDPVPGAGWAGNPYSYAGNDPLHALDPTGLQPVTDMDVLTQYAASNSGALAAAWDWTKNNWEYLAGGAAVIVGGAMIATGVGGPLGMMFVSAGLDTIVQKATTGSVNPWQVAVSFGFGAWGATGAATKLGARTLLQQSVVGGAVSGTASGATGSAVGYLTGPGPHTVGGFVRTTVVGAGTGGVLGGGSGALGHGLDVLSNRWLAGRTAIPLDEQARSLLGHPGDTVVLGRLDDTAVAVDWPEHVVLQTDDWSLALNDEFIRGTIDYQRPVYLASPIEGNMVQTGGNYAGQPTIYARELSMLEQAGYTFDGDYLLTPR